MQPLHIKKNKKTKNIFMSMCISVTDSEFFGV